jgi:hypothetical protein
LTDRTLAGFSGFLTTAATHVSCLTTADELGFSSQESPLH